MRRHHEMTRLERMLRWLYLGRLALATALFVAALANWHGASDPSATLLATLALLASLGLSAWGLWWVEVVGRAGAGAFVYAQVLFDVVLVTVAVQITGGVASPFPFLYIVVITTGALLLPVRGGVLVGLLAGALFVGVVLWPGGGAAGATEYSRAALFVVVAVVTSVLCERLRRTGVALGAAELELQRLRLDTNEMLEAIDTGLLSVDGEGRLTHANAAAEALLGGRLSEWLGRSVVEELETRVAGLGVVVRTTSVTRTPVSRYTLRRGDRYLNVRTTLLPREDVPWVTIALQDVTESKQLEDVSRRAERLEAVAELGASLAHEIRNPLASIRSAAEQLVSDRLSAKDRQVLRGLVVTESERLARLLGEFMEFTRIETRRWSTVDLDAIATAAVELVSRHPDRDESTRIQYRRPAAPLVVSGDRDLLHRAIFNLLLNAVQHSGDRGLVTLELEQAADDSPSAVPCAHPIRLTVRDNGPGVREEDAVRLFDPFYTTRTGGTGLGLAIVHRAVEAHRGAIMVDNPDTGGARFTIYLPAYAEVELEHGTQYV